MNKAKIASPKSNAKDVLVQRIKERSPAIYGYRFFLIKEFEKKINTKPSYSLRGFARFLDIHPSILSKILKGSIEVTPQRWKKLKQRLSLDEKVAQEIEIEERLGIASKFRQKWCESFDEVPAHIIMEIDKFSLVTEWYHFAILELTYLDDFESNQSYIQNKLSISASEAKEAIDRLFRIGLLNEVNGRWVDQYSKLSNATPLVTNSELKYYQSSLIKLSQSALEKIDVNERLQSSMCIAMNSNDIEWARNSIISFQRSLATELQARAKKQKTDSIYQYIISFFPLTKKE